MARFYEKILGCRNEGIYRVFTLFGIKFKRKNTRVQLLTEIRALTARCTNLAASLKALSDSSLQRHENISTLLTKGLTEINSQLKELNEIAGANHRAIMRQLGETHSLLQSHGEKLAEYRAMQEEVNRRQERGHQETAQKLDAANNLLKSHGAMLTEFRGMQEEINRQQERGHQETAQKLDAANNLLKSHGEALTEFRGMQEEVNKQQEREHQETTQKLDAANDLLKSHGEMLAEFRGMQEEINTQQAREHQETTQKLDAANNLLKSHGEMLAEFRGMQEEVNTQQAREHQETTQKLDAANTLLKSHGEKLAEFRSMQGEINTQQERGHQEMAQKLDAANNLLKSHGATLAEFRGMQEEVNKQQERGHQATTQKLDAANNLLKSHGATLVEFRSMQEEVNRQQEQGHQEMAQKLDAANNLLKAHGETLAEFRGMQDEVNRQQEQGHQEMAQRLGAANDLLKAHGETLAKFRGMQEEVNKQQERGHQEAAQKLDAASNLLKSHGETLAKFRGMQEETNKLQSQNHQGIVQKLDEASTLLRTSAGRTGSLLELKYGAARYYQHPLEKGFLAPFFEYMDRPDFEERYLALIRGMDPSSIREINKILSRVNVIKAKPSQVRFNFYSVQEQDERTRLVSNFRTRIIRLSDNLYAYDKYLLPINHFEVCVFFYKHGIELVRDKESIRDKAIIDAGAFIGDSALVLSDYTDKKIYSFEASPENFSLLKKTVEINRLSKVVPVRKALWSSETKLEMNASGSASSLLELQGIQYEKNAFKVQTVTLDNYVSKKKLRVGLIKVDLEGAELEFLKGAENTIRSQKPVLLLSIYHKPSDFFELKPLLEQWVPEYEFSVFNPVDRSILLETMIIAQPRSESGIPLKHNLSGHRRNKAS